MDELNRAIAEQVMGLRVEVTQEETSGYAAGARWVGGGDYYECDVFWAIPPDKYEAWASGEEDGEWLLPPYSTDISAAFLVIEKMRAAWNEGDETDHFWTFRDCGPYVQEGQGGWSVEIEIATDHDGMGTLQKAVAETLPAAICWCALWFVRDRAAGGQG